MGYIVKSILKDKGITIGAEIINPNGEIIRIKTSDLAAISNKIKFDNAILTSSGYLRGKNCSLPCKDINRLTRLYHGSRTGLHGEINALSSRTSCDFGKGFYTGDIPTQAQQIIMNEPDGIFYTLDADLSTLKTYKFKTYLEWALYVAYHREKIGAEYKN